jgi:hypothetical protein
LRNTDACLRGSAVDVDLLSRRKRKANATLPAWMHWAGTVLAAAALCGAAAGCAADTGDAASGKSDGSGQMRYYGGPKSPMWSDR